MAEKRANGQGSIGQRKDGRWVARYTDHTPEGPKRRALYAPTEAEAICKLNAALGHIERNEFEILDDDGSGSVYFIQAAQGGPIKIGRATDVRARFKAIQACCPVPLKILCVIPNGGHKVETELHRRFALFRLHGEWFDSTAELLAYIHAELKAQRDRSGYADDRQKIVDRVMANLRGPV